MNHPGIAFHCLTPGDKFTINYLKYAAPPTPSLEDALTGQDPYPSVQVASLCNTFQPTHSYSHAAVLSALFPIITDAAAKTNLMNPLVRLFTHYDGTAMGNRKFMSRVMMGSNEISMNSRVGPASVVYLHRNNTELIDTLTQSPMGMNLVVHEEDEYIETVMMHRHYTNNTDANGSIVCLVDDLEHPTCFELFHHDISNHVFSFVLEGSRIPYVTRHRTRQQRLANLLDPDA